jgi:uncharacterized membrane protein
MRVRPRTSPGSSRGYAALFLLVHAMTADKILKEIEGYGGTRAKNVAR